jgi:hypothetical protein
MDLPPSMNWDSLTNLGAVTMMGYIFWHVIVKGIPQIIERFTIETSEARKMYVAENQSARAEFKQSLKEVVDHCREENKTQSEQLLRAAAIGHENKRTKDLT